MDQGDEYTLGESEGEGMTEREGFERAIGAVVDGYDLLPVFKSVALLREAARIIAQSGALPIRRDNAADLFRRMIDEEAGDVFPITPEMVDAYHDEIEKVARAKR